MSQIVGKNEPGLTYGCWLSIKSLMWGSLNLQGLILISSKKLLLAESDNAIFSLILPSPALGELSEHTDLWEFIWWSPQLAFIILNTSQIVGWCTVGLKSGLTAFSATFHFWGRVLPGSCLAYALLPFVELPLQCTVYKEQSFHFSLTVPWCLFLLAKICSFVTVESSWCRTDPAPRNSPEILYKFLRRFLNIFWLFSLLPTMWIK